MPNWSRNVRLPKPLSPFDPVTDPNTDVVTEYIQEELRRLQRLPRVEEETWQDFFILSGGTDGDILVASGGVYLPGKLLPDSYGVSGDLTVSGELQASGGFAASGDWAMDGQPPSASETYTETNVSTLRSFDASSFTVDELADVLGTLIADLRTKGIIR
jgi:hypothetical protein